MSPSTLAFATRTRSTPPREAPTRSTRPASSSALDSLSTSADADRRERRRMAHWALAGVLSGMAAAGCASEAHWRAPGAPTRGGQDYLLQWDAVDPNELPLNPFWAVQRDDRRRLPPLNAACAAAAPDAPACTSQR